MVRFESLSASEKLYPYVKAVAGAEYKNGTFGAVVDGVFTAGADGTMVIMQVEKGDDLHTDAFTVKKDEPVRVADLTKAVGQIVNVTADELPDGVAVDNTLISDTDGMLIVGAGNLKVTAITPYGVKAEIVE